MNPLGNIFGNSPMGLLMDTFKHGGDPKVIAESLLRKYGNNPMLGELSKLISSNDMQGVEKLARNYFKEQGRSFDDEYSNFMNQLKM